jgi:hypothetical protein
VRPLRRIPAVVFAGDPRIWRTALVVAVPFVLLIAFYCLRPREYYTGTDNVEAYGYVAEPAAGEALCVPGVQVPAGTARVRLQLISATRVRPALEMTLTPAAGGKAIQSRLAPVAVAANRVSAAVFPLTPSSRTLGPASLCVTAAGVVNWAGTPFLTAPARLPVTAGGRPVSGRIAVWYLPVAGAERSYLSRLGPILTRASLFRPGIVGPWLYVLVLFVVLPGLALASLRCLALAVAGEAKTRRAAAWLFAIAALNFVSWALVTPSFQAPDEVDHFAYTQSLVERGQAPSRDPSSPLARWSSSESLALEDMSFFTDHQVGDTRPPWLSSQQRQYDAQVAALHPRSSDGGGNETSATHGPLYYEALAPAYLAASSSPFSELTLMRIVSALIGALTVVFTFLLARELAPGRPWLAVLAALLVAYQPMYGFISGAVNNDVGVNAGAAALELLLFRMLRRGVTLPSGVLTGALLIALPFVKGTALSLYPVAAVAFVATLWRHHRRSDLIGFAGLLAAGVLVRELLNRLEGSLHPLQGSISGGAVSAAGAANEALTHPFGFLAYLWEIFLPRLPFMAPHFETSGLPGFTIFVERGWGAFGWYDVLFPKWVFHVILFAMLLAVVLGVLAAVREWGLVRRNLLELGLLLLMPLAVIAGFEGAFYTTGARDFIPEFGRYTFPAIGPLAVLAVFSLHAFGRRRMVFAGSGLLVGMAALSYAAQLLTMTTFYA